MDATFLKQLQEQIIIGMGNDYLKDLDYKAVILPREYGIENLEKFEPHRSRFRGTMTTRNMDTFAEYVEKHCEDDSVCFVDADRMAASTIFNFGNKELPGHCDNKASLSLLPSVEYEAVLGLNNTHHSQKDFAEWLEDWASHLIAEDDDGKQLDMKKAIHSIRRLTIETKTEQNHEEGNFRSKRSAMEDVEAKSKENPLPAFLYFNCTPYPDFNEYVITLRVSVLTGGSAPKLVARIVSLDSLKNDIAEEFQQKVNKQIDGFVKTYIGSFQS